jgi:hypothetical protein
MSFHPHHVTPETFREPFDISKTTHSYQPHGRRERAMPEAPNWFTHAVESAAALLSRSVQCTSALLARAWFSLLSLLPCSVSQPLTFEAVVDLLVMLFVVDALMSATLEAV